MMEDFLMAINGGQTVSYTHLDVYKRQVSWCLGHLAEYVPPEIYDEKYAKWQFEDLPIIPEVWKVQVSERCV